MSEHLDYMNQSQNYGFAHSDPISQSSLEASFRTISSGNPNVRGNVDQNSAQENQYYDQNDKDPRERLEVPTHPSVIMYNQLLTHRYNGTSSQYQQSTHSNGQNERFSGHSGSSQGAEHHDLRPSHESSHGMTNHTQFQVNSSQSAAAVPIPAMAMKVSSLSNNYSGLPHKAPHVAAPPPAPAVHDGAVPKSRCVEEDYAIILHRSSSAAAKSSNTKYRCMFCNFTFVGGPQKIRVHLTGKRENGTRLSRCENCPEEIRKKLEERMRSPKETVGDTGLYDDDDVNTPSLPPRNMEEHHTIVLSRSTSSNSKSSNTRYKCIYCRFKFVGGPQKIRVHLTGQQEGGTRMTKCTRVPEEVIQQMEHRRKAPKPDMLATPAGTAAALAHAAHAAGHPPVEHPAHPALATAQAIQQQQAYTIQQQQQALLKQQQQHAAQLQIQQQQLQQLQRQQQMQQHLHAQQQLQQQQHIQQLHHLHQQQMQQQLHQQHLSTLPLGSPVHGAPLHAGQVPLHLHQQQLLHQYQQQQHQLRQQQLQHPHGVPHHQQLPSHMIFHSSSPTSHLLQQQQLLHQPLHPHMLHGGLNYDALDETGAPYVGELGAAVERADQEEGKRAQGEEDEGTVGATSTETAQQH